MLSAEHAGDHVYKQSKAQDKNGKLLPVYKARANLLIFRAFTTGPKHTDAADAVAI